MKRCLSTLFMVLALAACDTTDADNLMMVPGPWITAGEPGHYEIVVRKLLGVRSGIYAYHDELQLKALKLSAETAKENGATRFIVLRTNREAVKKTGGFWHGHFFPLIRMDIQLLKKGEVPPEGKAVLVPDQVIRQTNEKLKKLND